MMYTHARLLYIRAYTPLHVGVGRGEGGYVDLPIQRDEYGYPVIWGSSLKGAIKANIEGDLKKFLGSEPAESTIPSAISFLDARLLLIPMRVLSGVWIYGTTTHILNVVKSHTEILHSIARSGVSVLDTSKLPQNRVITTRGNLIHDGKVIVNEVELAAEVKPDILSETKLISILPNEIATALQSRGVVVIPDGDGVGQRIVNRSMVIQYRVRMEREAVSSSEQQKVVRRKKVVATGGLWSEEYVPMESIYISLILCRDAGGEKAENLCESISRNLNGRFIYIGGKETIGKGLVKLYTAPAPAAGQVAQHGK